MSDTSETQTVGTLVTQGAREIGALERTIADRYELREFLGRGGSGIVYRAFDRLLKGEVALKLIHPERNPERALSRMRREIVVAREVESPRLVRVFEVGQSPEGLFLTMEILPGGSLRELLLSETQLPLVKAKKIAEDVLEGLVALHSKGVLHRDVTPGNILFGSNGEAKLADYGLARHRDQEETLVTEYGALLGTAGYLSPEQSRGQEATEQSDLYALGVVLFRMLAGRLPTEMSSSFGTRLAALVSAPSVRSFRPETPRWLASVIARLLEVNPRDRYRNAEAVLRDLHAHNSSGKPRVRRRILQTVAAALLCLPLAGALVTWMRHDPFSHLVPAGETGIKAISKGGATLWRIPEVDPSIADRWALARITPGGRRLLAIVRVLPGRWLPEDISTLSFLDPTSGEVVKEVTLPSGAGAFSNDPPRFMVASVKVVDLLNDGVDVVIVSYSHVPEAPFYAVLYTPRFDYARLVYFSRGGQDFQGAVDLDGDGSKELLFAGINNGWNWVNVVAAVRMDPASLKGTDRFAPAAAPDTTTYPDHERQLLWYAVVPRGHLQLSPLLTIDEGSRELQVHYTSGRTFALGFDGFPPGDAAAVDQSERQDARMTAYRHLREAERLRQAGALELAITEAESAIDSATKAGETWVGQYGERVRARLLVVAGRNEEAERVFLSLTDRAEDAPEVAYDAAVAYHLQGDLSRAAAWYERGIGRESALGAGKSKHEFLKGAVLALVELGKYSDAFAATARFDATYPAFANASWLYREFIRWRSGERPKASQFKVPPNGNDLERYWELEFQFANGAKPAEILVRVDSFLSERPETRAELLSLRAELLARLGRTKESEESVGAALELVQRDAALSITARGHLPLVAERFSRLRSGFQRASHDVAFGS